ncbi:MAG: hypothetical protein SNJ82_03425, partial [Gemmataceae bacterium]
MSASNAAFLVSRLCQPRRIGLLGRRGVGKTTLLTMLYREASQGRIPGLRLASADDRTAEYLRDKITQLEQGQRLPATLAQTELRFNFYHEDRRVELILLDYQGEHVELGQTEPIRAFFQSCDVVLLCLDPSSGQSDLTTAEMEFEQLIEEYLRQPPEGEAHRPMALLQMKADLAASSTTAFDERFAVQTRHTLAFHTAKDHAAKEQTAKDFRDFAGYRPLPVSSFRQQDDDHLALQPQGLDQVLQWIADSLYRLDASRLAHLFRTTASVPLKRRALRAFAHAYPSDPLLEELAPEVRIDWAWWRRVGIGLTALLLLPLAAMFYDRWGAAQMLAQDERLRDDPRAAHRAWQRYERWHPTRHLFGAADPQRARATAYAAALVELESCLDHFDLVQVQENLAQLKQSFADVEPPHMLARLQAQLDDRRQLQAAHLLADLQRREATEAWEQLLSEAIRLARDYAGLPVQEEFNRKAAEYRDRLDER